MQLESNRTRAGKVEVMELVELQLAGGGRRRVFEGPGRSRDSRDCRAKCAGLVCALSRWEPAAVLDAKNVFD